MNVVVIGTGYVGLVAGACFAEFGAQVTCVDDDTAKITKLNDGTMPIYEPGLEPLIATHTANGQLRFTATLAEPVAQADLVFIAVGTPTDADGTANLDSLYSSVRALAVHLRGYTVIVNKSTAPVGTAKTIQRIVQEAVPEAEFDVAANPEFLSQSTAINDFMNPGRIVIGVENPRAAELLRALYLPLDTNDLRFLVTNTETAELIKYASNAFLATKISFINELTGLCEAVGANVRTVAEAMGLDPRIGSDFLRPGPGYGGSCLPKDIRTLAHMSRQHGASSRLVEAVMDVNTAHQARMTDKIIQALGGSAEGRTLAVLGLTFKPRTDDMREAPALSILPAIVAANGQVRAHDPQGMENAQRLLPAQVLYCDDCYETCRGADAVVLMTEWKHYRELDLARVKALLSGTAFIDLRNVYHRAQVESHGLRYFGVGL